MRSRRALSNSLTERLAHAVAFFYARRAREARARTHPHTSGAQPCHGPAVALPAAIPPPSPPALRPKVTPRARRAIETPPRPRSKWACFDGTAGPGHR